MNHEQSICLIVTTMTTWLHLSMLSPHDLQCVLDQPVCCMLYILYLGLIHSSYVVHVYFLCDVLWPEVQLHPDGSHVHATSPHSTCALTETHPTNVMHSS